MGKRRPAWLTPGLLVAGIFLVLIIFVAVAVLITRDGDGKTLDNVTIAELRADPSGYDGNTVELVGTVSRRYTIPVLDQYGLYEFDDGTGTLFVLSDKGVPPDDGQPVRLTAIYNGAARLDEQIKALIEDQLGSAVGLIAEQFLPSIPLNVAFLTHQRFEPLEDDATERGAQSDSIRLTGSLAAQG